MVVKRCCVQKCTSAANREEDRGVTFHKLPNSVEVRNLWVKASRMTAQLEASKWYYVCSRHFRKADFQMVKGSKFMLKSGSVPTIFPWNIDALNCLNKSKGNISQSTHNMATKADIVDGNLEGNLNGNLNDEAAVTDKISATESSVNTDGIQNSNQKDEIERRTDDQGNEAKNSEQRIDELSMDSQGSSLTDDVISIESGSTLEPKLKENKIDSENPLPLIEGMKSDARMLKKIINRTAFKSRGTKRKRKGRVGGGASKMAQSTATSIASIDRGVGTMALSVGSKVEVKDFGDQWHPARILEVDYDEMEVLVHYDNWAQRSDEWISVSSPRLRPAAEPPSRVTSVRVKPGRATPPPLVYRLGERCLAKWSDNRRFLATVRAVLDEGQYEIIFDDGFVRVCKANLLSKLKLPEGDVSAQMSADRSNASSPIDLPLNLPPAPILYHKHLFDPSRDYLGSKKERREMKRKLNVKELFGAKKKRAQPAAKASKSKLKWKPERKKGKAPVVRKRQKIDFMGDVPSTSAVVEDSSIEKKAVEEGKVEKRPKELAAAKDLVSEIPEQPTDTLPAEELKRPEPATPAEEKPTAEAETNINNISMEATLREAVLAAPQPQIKLERIRQKKETKRSAKRDKKAERMKVKIQFKLTKVKKLDAGKVRETLAEDLVGTASSTTPVLSADDILKQQKEIEEVVLGEGEWCCKWLNGQPVGVVSEIETQVVTSEVSDGSSASQQPLARRSVQVDDKRLPLGWTKHMVRRSHGNSAGKWDVVLVCPEGRRFRTRLEMRTYLDEQGKAEFKAFEDCLLDFGVHRKRAKRLGWDMVSSDTTRDPVPITLPANSLSAITSPIGRKKKLKLTLKKPDVSKVLPKVGIKRRRRSKKVPDVMGLGGSEDIIQPGMVQSEGFNEVKSSTMTPTGDVTLGGTSQELPPVESSPLEEGYVYVGSLKVQMIDNLYYRCPKEGCFKNFRKDNLLRMHIKHYHREMRKLMGVTPKVADLAYARTVTEDPPAPTPKSKSDAEKVHRPKAPKVPKITEADTPVLPKKEIDLMRRELFVNTETADVNETPLKTDGNQYETLEDSPKLRSALENETSAKKLPLVKLEFEDKSDLVDSKIKLELLDNTVQMKEIKAESLGNNQIPFMDEDNIDEEGFKLRFDDDKSNEYLEDYEKSISAYTVPKDVEEIPATVEVPKVKRSRYEKKRLSQWKDGVKVSKKRRQLNIGVQQRKLHNEMDVWEAFTSDADETQSGFGNIGQHSRPMEKKPGSLGLPLNMQEMAVVQVEPQPDNMFITESGEKIRIVRMKREEIINCHCGYGEEDGLMVQCELCLCWQHAICHNIERESQVPEKYVCAICTNPRRGRRSARWLHEQGWLYEGALPSWAASSGAAGGGRAAALRRSHELAGNLLLLADALHAMRVKMQVAGKKDHPKLYLWSGSWEQPAAQEVAPEAIITETVSMDDDLIDMPKLDLGNMMESEVGKENCPISKLPDPSPDADPTLPRDSGSGEAEGASLVGLLGGNDALRLPISTSELERLAKSVQDCDVLSTTTAPPPPPSAPEPEKAIDWAECRLRLLQHIERAQAAIDARLDSIEAQVAELESQDPSLEDDETADFYPQTKQTIQMLVRDLNTMEELALIT